MIKKASIYRFIIVLMIFSLFVPAGATNAQSTSGGKLTVHKFEREPGVADGEAGNGSADQTVPTDAVKLPGVTFEFTQTHAYDAATDKWTVVTAGTPFTRVTDANGEIVIDNIELGRYKVQEIAGPARVNLNRDIFYVDIPMTNLDRETVNFDVHIYPKNETIRGAVELTKIDGDSEAALTNVEFALYNADGTLVQEGLKTNADGKIIVDDLAYGAYYFTEVATNNGYVLGSKRTDFSIDESGVVTEDGERSGEIVEVNVENFVEPEIEKEINVGATNRGEEVTYTLTTDLPGDITEYKTFEITDVLDGRLSYVTGTWAVSGVDAAAITFTHNGQELSWEINDFAAFAGVSQVVITFDAKIAEDAPANQVINNKASIEFENKHGNGGDKETDDVPLIPTAGSLIIIKQDGDTDARLQGAEFELRDAQGNKIARGTTDGDGVINFGELDYGEYTLHETKAPNDYRKLLNPIDVSVNSDKDEHTIVVDNFKSGWDLPKTGGIGTMLFTLIGLTFMAAALGLYFRRRKYVA